MPRANLENEVGGPIDAGARLGAFRERLFASFVRRADALLMTKGNMTYHLCHMAERGLVDRRPEGRKNRLYLTGEGRRLLEEALPEHEALINERFSGLSVEERAQLADLLGKLERSQP